MAVLGLRFCTRAFSSCGKWGPLLIAVRGPLTIAASLAEHRLQTRRLSSCDSRAQLPHGMWDPPRPGLEPCLPVQVVALHEHGVVAKATHPHVPLPLALQLHALPDVEPARGGNVSIRRASRK